MKTETGSVRKDPGGKLNIALVYPNTYWVGMSNLGLHAMYRSFNEHPDIVCERFFTDHYRSVESSRPLQDFHIIALSVSYELDWISMVRILIDNRITVRANARRGKPIVIAGGSAISLNPEPIADTLDLCFIGDGEAFPERLYEAFDSAEDLDGFLDAVQDAPGVYVPSRTYPLIEGDSIIGFEGRSPEISVIDPFTKPAYTQIITRDTAFGDMFMVETAKGCPFSCKFCTAREIYSPFRPAPVDTLCSLFDMAPQAGQKIGLVSTSLNNHPYSAEIFAGIIDRGLKAAPPSLRLGMITDDLLDVLRQSKVMGVTLAPETGSDALRKSIGKPVDNDVILEDVRSLILTGLRDIKLYFMVGLPGEVPEDIDATIDLVKRVRQLFIQVSRGNRRIGKIALSINTMVPKPHTFYERHAMIETSEAKARIKKIVKALRSQSNVTVSFEGPKWAYLQSLLSRGDRSVLDLITRLAQAESSRWKDILRQWPRNPDYYAMRQRSKDEILPWSFYSRR